MCLRGKTELYKIRRKQQWRIGYRIRKYESENQRCDLGQVIRKSLNFLICGSGFTGLFWGSRNKYLVHGWLLFGLPLPRHRNMILGKYWDGTWQLLTFAILCNRTSLLKVYFLADPFTNLFWVGESQLWICQQ